MTNWNQTDETVLEASVAIAMTVRNCGPKVIPMYPITPQTHIVEKIADLVSNGEMDAEIIPVESEHSALSAVLGAQATGVRTYTATSSQGFALMYEILPIVSGLRLPCVMTVANRALSAPINIWNDHSDSVSARDQGWIQLYSEDAQEAVDTTVMAFKIAENKDVLLPVMPCIDGFSLSHVYEPVSIPSKKKVDAFLPAYKPKDVLDPKNPISFGTIGTPNVFMEFKKQQQEAMENSVKVIKKVNKEFGEIFGRKYGDGLIQKYKMSDAEYAIIAMGTVCATAHQTVDKLRKEGHKIGIIKLKSLRPFPVNDLRKIAKNLKGLCVIDRHMSLGYEGALSIDIRAALCEVDIQINTNIAGIGGRDIKAGHLEKALMNLINGKPGEWLF
ncbi:MAG: transketolase C-terminal domain-containing protein [Candidatus Diapherotrites archaeon]